MHPVATVERPRGRTTLLVLDATNGRLGQGPGRAGGNGNTGPGQDTVRNCAGPGLSGHAVSPQDLARNDLVPSPLPGERRGRR